MAWWSKLFGGPEVVPTPVRTADEFRSVVGGSPVPVIVDVWSPTCAPCKKLVPVLLEVANRHAGKVLVVEIDAHSAEPGLVAALGVSSTPTLVIYDGGEELGRVTGFRPPGWFHEMIAAEFGEA